MFLIAAHINTRKCTECGCKASGGSCHGILRLYKDNACSTNEMLTMEGISSEFNLCSNFSMTGTEVGSKEMTDIVYVPGSCDASGGTCYGTLRWYEDALCTNDLSMMSISSDLNECDNLMLLGVAVGSKEMTDIVYVPGSCEATGGVPVGTAYPDESTAATWCCMAAPKGMKALNQ